MGRGSREEGKGGKQRAANDGSGFHFSVEVKVTDCEEVRESRGPE